MTSPSTLDGDTISLSDYEGDKVVIVDFRVLEDFVVMIVDWRAKDSSCRLS